MNSKKEVDETMAEAKKVGAKIVKLVQKTFWGSYAGYFQDPDGHLWEIMESFLENQWIELFTE